IWAAYTSIKILHGIATWYFSNLTPDKIRVKAYSQIIRISVHLIIWIIAGSMVLHKIGIDITPLVATLGVGGLAVGLALQDTLANFFAGFYIIIERNIEPGDYIELEGTSVKGYVEQISWRTTRIRTLSNNSINVPNSRFAQSITTNYTIGDRMLRVSIPFMISYDNNLESVEQTVIKAAKEFIKEHPNAIKKIEPGFIFTEFGESNINCSLNIAIDNFDNMYAVRSALIKYIKRELERHRISISWPKRIIYQK
ncbi:MAG: mechanosensitive ion channel family protein, partial [Nanoarchaeota archaeon]